MNAHPCHDIPALRRAGATLREIAALTGLSVSSVQRRLSGKAQRTEAPKPKQRTTPRACLCCGKTFPSEGAHHRLCERCRKDGASPFDTPATVHYR